MGSVAMLDVESWLVARLLTGTIHGAAVIALVWLVCRRWSGIPAAGQAALWWLASLKLLLVFAPIPVLSLPMLPVLEPAALPAVAAAAATPPVAVSATPAVTTGTPLWLSMVVALWVNGLLVLGVRLWLACRAVRAVVARATPLPAADAGIAPAIARAAGLRACPEVRLSGEIAAPLVAGVRRPVVLLPSTLPESDRPMAICHEFIHVRRHDLALGWVPALAERLFFFHPLARLAAREYITAREAACDAGVVRALGVPAGDYGRLLVRLGVAPVAPMTAAGGAPASMASLRRRLHMLQQSSSSAHSRHFGWLLAAVLGLSLVPLNVTARSVLPTPPAAPVLSVLPSLPVLPVAPVVAAPAHPVLPAVPSAPVAQAPGSAAPVGPGPLSPFPALSDEQREVLARMRALENELWRRQMDVAEYNKAIEQYNQFSAQADRLARSYEEALHAGKQSQEAVLRGQNAMLAEQIQLLRAQQEELTRQLNDVAAKQREFAEMQREIERFVNTLKERQF